MIMKSFQAHSNDQKGAGFIEVLVALVILAIGLLGVLSMQSRGLGSNQRAVFATEVNTLAADMADRILSYDTAGAVNGEFDGIDSAAVPAFADAVIQQHSTAWINLVNASSLPAAVATVDWDGDAAAYTITVQWDDERTGIVAQNCDDNRRDANGNRLFLTCFELMVNL